MTKHLPARPTEEAYVIMIVFGFFNFHVSIVKIQNQEEKCVRKLEKCSHYSATNEYFSIDAQQA